MARETAFCASARGYRRQRRAVAFALLVALAIGSTTPRLAAATTLLSVDLGGAPSGGVGLNRNPGSTADVSPDGRFVVFTSTASDLVAGVADTNSGADVFLSDIQAGTTAILSVDTDGNALGAVGNSALSAFVFSPDSTRLLKPVGIDGERHVNIAGEARLAVHEHRLASDDHVPNARSIERGGETLKQVFEH